MLAQFEQFIKAGISLREKYEYNPDRFKEAHETSEMRSSRISAENIDEARRKINHVLMLNTLASYYLEGYKKVGTLAVRADLASRNPDDLLNFATALLNKAERLSRFDTFTLLLKGSLQVIRGDSAGAMYTFRGALNQEPNCIPILTSIAAVHFAKGDFKLALLEYQKVLRIGGLGQDIPDIRIKVGICFHRLSMFKQAQKAFERAIEMQPCDATPKMLLSAMHLSASETSLNDEDRLRFAKSSKDLLIESFKLNPKNSLAANRMAELFLQSNKGYEKPNILAASALKYATNPKVRSHSLVIQARISQAQVMNEINETVKV